MDRFQPQQFDWPVVNEAENFLREHIESFLKQNSFARALSERMSKETATDLFEWIDHLQIEATGEGELRRLGFAQELKAETGHGERVYEHPLATLPRVLIGGPRGVTPLRMAIRVESLNDFMERHNLSGEPPGESFSRYRYLDLAGENNTIFAIVERCAYRGFAPAHLGSGELEKIVSARKLWQRRPRLFAKDAEGFRAGNEVLEQVIDLVDIDRACQMFFELERDYWESRNRVARFQKDRQDQLGLGWGNHDHHTFRCSRQHFVDLISFLLKLGFKKRERYYAGAEAGWGAQICEHRAAGIVVFADVDLLPEETQVDFSTTRLAPSSRLGTVGLWVGLHGESFLEAGMHHLEARFEFALLEEQLQSSGFKTMKPFSDFDFLRQAFTEGERWSVRPERATQLLSAGLITQEQFDRFMKEGAIGSHLENLQRHGGFKGFNQKSVSAVIQATDPRKNQWSQVPAAA